ncbi:hypothetical protein Dsin_019668 [Dipteronia sinensis]|uniref:Uncharacterized protein n=1 Tax=Dipteronia sinensis TaxID=43782 RepID=A0AAE0A7Q4_9ROSI|nr:hypothetical protein Dsin_019668 [Dipteronia sinensis]
MIDSEMAKLYENLSLADEDGAIHEMSDDAQRAGEAEVDNCLVGLCGGSREGEGGASLETLVLTTGFGPVLGNGGGPDSSYVASVIKLPLSKPGLVVIVMLVSKWKMGSVGGLRVSWPHRSYNWSFRFEPFWLKEKDFDSVVRKVWTDSGPSNSVEEFKWKLSQCAARVMHSIKSLEKSVVGLLECEELYWKQCSQANWLEARDHNSKFFHAKATARKKKNFIDKLVDRGGCVYTSKAELAFVMKDYFSTIFQYSNPSVQDTMASSVGINSRLSDVKREELSAVYTTEEVRATREGGLCIQNILEVYERGSSQQINL